MFHDVEGYISNCEICQKNKFAGPYIKAPFQETDTQYQPMGKLYLDIVGPLPMTEGYKYILTCQDNLSKYLLAVLMITQTANEVSLTFLRYVILHYGIPNSI
jgi:cleavage and polyadenylation specificity factor subunit 1